MATSCITQGLLYGESYVLLVLTAISGLPLSGHNVEVTAKAGSTVVLHVLKLPKMARNSL